MTPAEKISFIQEEIDRMSAYDGVPYKKALAEQIYGMILIVDISGEMTYATREHLMKQIEKELKNA